MTLRARSESPLLSEDFTKDACPLFSAQAARKKAEQDSILLANRLRLLRQEDEKTQKRIRETRQKTEEIMAFRRRNEERRLERDVEEMQREAHEQEMRERWGQQRGEQQQRVREQQRSILERNYNASNQQRQEREQHKAMIQDTRIEAMSAAAAKRDRVKKMHRAACESRARSEDAKHALAKGMIEERVRREDQERSVRLADIARMEAEEAELLIRLQRSQERHKAAYMQLEDALRNGGSAYGPSGRSGFSTPSASSRCGDALPREALRGLQGLQPAASASSGFVRDMTSSAGTTMSSAGVIGASGGACKGNAAGSRPPRPRAGSQTRASAAAQGVSAANAAIAAVTGALAEGRAVNVSSQRGSFDAHGSAPTSDSVASSVASSGAFPDKLQSGRLSSQSTASGGDLGSGRSTPSTVSMPAPIVPHVAPTYTTHDGVCLEIPTEEDLDLASLLNL